MFPIPGAPGRVLLAAVLLLATGCQIDRNTPPTDTDAAAAGVPDASASADSGLPASLSGLGLQANHASGSVLRVTAVRFEADHIAVATEFTNGADFEQKLNQHSNNRLVLRDNLGNVYNLSAPPNNGEVAVTAGQSLNGEFVFLGRLHPDATALTLVTNEEYGGSEDHSRDPKMTIQIPLS